MEALLTGIGYVIALVAVFVIAMLKPQSTAGRGFTASGVALIILAIVNGFVLLISSSPTNADITAEQIAKELYGLEEKKQYPLLLTPPDGNVGERVVFTIDPQRPLARNGHLLVRLSLSGKSYELELPVTLKQQPSAEASVQLEFHTPRNKEGGIYGDQTIVSSSPCDLRAVGVFWCDIEHKYRADFSKELRSMSILDFLKDSLVSATFTVPPDVYRTIKLG
jgi:hypothetical protein